MKGITFLEKILNLISDFSFLTFSVFLKIFSFNCFKKDVAELSDNKTIILCNGPSLKKDLKWIEEVSESSEIYAVHYFALSEYFFKLKPKFYFLADPLFWRDGINRDFKGDNEKLFEEINSVDWDMTIIVPEDGLESLKKRIKNKNIKLKKIRYWPINFNLEILTIFALKLKLITPIFSTVAVMALWHAIIRRKKEIYLFGADFSAFAEYSVNQTTNELTNTFSHFYKNTKAQKYAMKKYVKRNRYMLHKGLYMCWCSFYQMFLLSKVAKEIGLKVFNGSSNSFLDSFDRFIK